MVSLRNPDGSFRDEVCIAKLLERFYIEKNIITNELLEYIIRHYEILDGEDYQSKDLYYHYITSNCVMCKTDKLDITILPNDNFINNE
jgi:hypothetical protein